MSDQSDQDFEQERAREIAAQADDAELQSLSRAWLRHAQACRYSYHFDWLGRPIIQYPQDIVAMQELIWSVAPDLVIETGIARGGSLILSASVLALLDYRDAVEGGTTLDPKSPRRRVLGVDIDIRAHNRAAIEAHPLAQRIDMIEGSSTAPETIRQVHETAAGCERVLVCLDSSHAHEHVLAELEAYAPLASVGSYCVVFDTIVEDLPAALSADRPWGPGDNPRTAVRAFLEAHPGFETDRGIGHRLLISVAPDGYLRRLR